MVISVGKSFDIIDGPVQDRRQLLNSPPWLDEILLSQWAHNNGDLSYQNSDPVYRVVLCSPSPSAHTGPEFRRLAADFADIKDKLVVFTYGSQNAVGGVSLVAEYVPVRLAYIVNDYTYVGSPSSTLRFPTRSPLFHPGQSTNANDSNLSEGLHCWVAGFILAMPSSYTLDASYKASIEPTGWDVGATRYSLGAWQDYYSGLRASTGGFQVRWQGGYYTSIDSTLPGFDNKSAGQNQSVWGTRFRSNNPIRAARGQKVTGAYILTSPGRMDSDGVRQHTLTTPDLDRYFPDRVTTTGKIAVESIDRLGRLDPTTVLLDASGNETIRTTETPPEVNVEGVVTGRLDPDKILRRGRVTLDGKVWIVDSLADANGEGAYRLTLFRYDR